MNFVLEHRRTLALGGLLTLWISALVGFASSPARASYYEWGVSFSTDVVRNSVTYRLNVKALEAMGGSRLEAKISLRDDPAGPTALRQAQTWTYHLDEGEFTHEGDTYRIDAGSDAGPFRVNLIIERRQDVRCSNAQQLFVTRPDAGEFRIETGNDVFGRITELPECARIWDYSSGPRPGPPPCPLRGQELGSPTLNVKERRGGETIRLGIYQARERGVPGGRADWSVDVRGRLPAANFRLNRDLEGSLTGQRAPWLAGKARFEPQQPATRSGWYDCRGGREARSLVADGAITGDLTLDVIGYENYRIKEPNAWALRSRVRPRR